MALLFPMLASRVRRIENYGRIDRTDRAGGTIVRTFYVEPYSAYRIVETALRGTTTVDPNAPTVGGLKGYMRIKPHADPFKPWYYCTDTIVEPWKPPSIRACAPTGFDPANNDGNADYNGQLTACKNALNNVDDFDFANNPETLTPPQIAAGTFYKPANNVQSKGQCGAKITAVYRPLVYLQGLPPITPGGSNLDPFDYVLPEKPWSNETLRTQTGRRLFVFRPIGGTLLQQCGGLDDTFAIPEVIWRFHIRRLMVPFLPQSTISLFRNKINGGTYGALQALGNSYLSFPATTVRLDEVDPEFVQGPDGNTWYNLDLYFSVRTLYDEFADERALSFVKGWIGWNHQFAIPTNVSELGINIGLQIGTGSYYPVGWNGGLYQTMGKKHPLFLADTDTDMQLIPYVAANGNALVQSLFKAPFQAGFYANQ